VCGVHRAGGQKGKSVYVYGASTKGNTILQYYGLDNRLIAEPPTRAGKVGKVYGRVVDPIVSEEEARNSADYF